MTLDTVSGGVEYLGADLAAGTLEVLGMKIDPTHREGEADLVRSRWFDYLHLHPVQATYLYAHHYRQQTRQFCEQYVDVRSAEEVAGFTPDDVFYSRDLTAMWLARREADRHGLPYDFVLQFAREHFFGKLFHRFPRPNQLYSEEFMLDVNDAWQERLRYCLTYSRLAHFTAAAWRATDHQQRHLKFVIDQIQRRGDAVTQARLLARLMQEGVLAAGPLQGRVDETVLDRAVELARPETACV